MHNDSDKFKFSLLLVPIFYILRKIYKQNISGITYIYFLNIFLVFFSSIPVPSSPILHLTVINATALEVEWSMPNDNPYPVSGYYLSYRPHNLPLKQVTLPANTTKYQLFDLGMSCFFLIMLS